jgi:uncharacterized protein with NRDE domain
MCLIVFAWRPSHALPLIVAANRDEFYDRPSLPLGHWPDAPQVIAGRDLQGGGTWMGLTEQGRFAALTNIRDPSAPTGSRSRGELSADFLRSELEPHAYLSEVSGHVEHYSGFNLLVGDAHELWYLNSREAVPRQLSAGVYGLSNAALDSPWPKLVRARAAMQDSLEQPDTEALMQLLADSRPAADHELPDTGVPHATEKMLSSVFINSADYGTVASTVLIRRADGSLEAVERSFGVRGLSGETRVVVPARPDEAKQAPG